MVSKLMLQLINDVCIKAAAIMRQQPGGISADLNIDAKLLFTTP